MAGGRYAASIVGVHVCATPCAAGVRLEPLGTTACVMRVWLENAEIMWFMSCFLLRHLHLSTPRVRAVSVVAWASQSHALYMTYVSFVRLQWTLSRMECMHAECMRHACRFFSIVDVKVPLFLTGFRCGPRLRIEFRSAVGLPVPQVKLD